MKQFVFLILPVIYLFNACNEVVINDDSPVDTPWGTFSKNYVNAYIEPKLSDTMTSWYIETWERERGSFKLEQPSLMLVFGFNTPEEDIIRERLYPEELWYPQEKVYQFRELAKKNNDTCFNRDGSFGGCLVDPVESINIVSDSDYDDVHPAGTSLNDIIYIEFRSATEFVASGYTDEKYDTKKHPYDLLEIEPLTQFLEKKRNLVDGFFGFIFHHLPTKASEHNFTIYYDDVAGRHFEIPVSVSVEKEIVE
jgi:hypothetical protein